MATRVEWLGWDSAAFERARARDLPILLSIGSAWCDLTRSMEEETFSDDACAALINARYVPVRVDGERRPDIFDRYNMGGTPSTVFLMPDGQIIAGVTYVPAREMKQILAQLATAYQTQRDRLSEEIRTRETRIFQARQSPYPAADTIGPGIFQNTVRGIAGTFDAMHGGFGRAPKFPHPASLGVLLQAFAETGGADFAEMLVRTLDAMADRALFDEIDGGFFRASTNDLWTVPHHAKLLADQAGLIRVFRIAAQLFEEPRYRTRADAALAYTTRVLKDPARPLYFASQAADRVYYAPGGRREPDRTPPVDRTILTDANAQLASAMFFDEHGDGAAETVRALWELTWDPGRGCRRGPDAVGFHLLRDTVWVAHALIDRYEWTGDRADLERASEAIETAHRRFWNDAENGLVDRAEEQPFGEMRRIQKNLAENASAALSDVRLAALLEEPNRRARAEKVLMGFPNFMHDYGHYTAELAEAADRLIRPAVEVRLEGCGPEMARAACSTYVPRKVVRHTNGSAKACVMRPGAAPAVAATPEALTDLLKG